MERSMSLRSLNI